MSQVRQSIDGGGRIVALLPGLARDGGIQRHNRMLCRELTAYCRGRGLALEVVSFADPPGWHDPALLEDPARSCGGSKARFAWELGLALSRPYALCVVGHIDFAALSWPFQLLRPRARHVIQTYGVEVWAQRSRLERRALGSARAVWTISDYTAGQLRAVQGLGRERLVTIAIPLDAGFRAAAAGQVAERQAGAAGLVTVARLSASEVGKGIDQVIAALPAVLARVPEAVYTIVGAGDDVPRLKALAAAWGVAGRVRFAGRLSDEALHAALAGAELFVMPSRKEGFGIVFLEAMAHGLPVVAGAHGGTPEVVIHGETGLLVPGGCRVALEGALIGLLADPQRRRQLGEAGRQRVATVYGYERFSERIAGELDALLAR